jgi:hypothetical protein
LFDSTAKWMNTVPFKDINAEHVVECTEEMARKLCKVSKQLAGAPRDQTFPPMKALADVCPLCQLDPLVSMIAPLCHHLP